MFAYCLNNPICVIDPTGTCGYVFSIYFWSDCGEIDCPHSRAYKEGDFSEELAVLRGKTDTYKGHKVYKVLGDDEGLSFGNIYLGKNTLDTWGDVLLLRHEYGHTIQLEKLGVEGYVPFVAIPSVIGIIKRKMNLITWDEYYMLPQELQANVYGNAIEKVTLDQTEAVEYALYGIAVKCFETIRKRVF